MEQVRATQGMALLRIVVGILLLHSALSHLAWAPMPVATFSWVQVLQTQLMAVAAVHPQLPVRDLVNGSLLPAVISLARGMALLELAAGLSLVPGLLTVLGAACGVVLVVARLFLFFPLGGPAVVLDLLLVALLLVFLIARAGRRWGLDGLLARLRPSSRLW